MKEFVEINDKFCLVDGKIFVKFAYVFERIDDMENLESLEAILGADLKLCCSNIFRTKKVSKGKWWQ